MLHTARPSGGPRLSREPVCTGHWFFRFRIDVCDGFFGLIGAPASWLAALLSPFVRATPPYRATTKCRHEGNGEAEANGCPVGLTPPVECHSRNRVTGIRKSYKRAAHPSNPNRPSPRRFPLGAGCFEHEEPFVPLE